MSAPEPDADEVAARLEAGAATAALEIVRERARETPVLVSGTLSERFGTRILLKAENLQRTGSFKLRGALHRLAHIGDAMSVVAGSAGNHAQALA